MSTARKPKAKAAPRLNLRVLGIVLLVAMVTVPVAVLAGRSIFVTRSEFETTIRDAGFYPLNPPSKLVMPGSIYQVSQDGRFYTTICRADQADVEPITQVSETEDVVASSLENGTFDLTADAAKEINAHLNGNLVRAVQYSLRDVAVLEIPLAENEEIFVKLTAASRAMTPSSGCSSAATWSARGRPCFVPRSNTGWSPPAAPRRWRELSARRSSRRSKARSRPASPTRTAGSSPASTSTTASRSIRSA